MFKEILLVVMYSWKMYNFRIRVICVYVGYELKSVRELVLWDALWSLALGCFLRIMTSICFCCCWCLQQPYRSSYGVLAATVISFFHHRIKMIQAELNDIMLKNLQQPDVLASPAVLTLDKYKQNCILLGLTVLFSS